MPKVSEIATKNVLTIDDKSTIEDAIRKMANAGLRSIIVYNTHEGKNVFSIFTTSEIIELKLSNYPLINKLRTLQLPSVKAIPSNLSIISLLHDSDIMTEYMVLVDDNELKGIVSYTDVINNVDPQFLMERQTIGKIILQYKAKTAFHNESTISVISQLKQSEDDAVIIVEDRKPIGIFTTKDFLNIINQDANLTAPIKHYMTVPIDTLHENTTISDAINYIKIKKFKRIVIVDNFGQLSGVISQRELLRLVYNKWVEIIKNEGIKLSKLNENLIKKNLALEEKIHIDFLTQIYNRHKFEDLLEYELLQLERNRERNLSLLIVDIDDFKKINDSNGHLVGDCILKEFARIISICLRKSDILARWGGEEFVIMLPEANIERAFLVAEKLRATIENHQFVDDINVTCSIGIASYHIHQTKEELFKRADIALYNAKNTGKNKVEMETSTVD